MVNWDFTKYSPNEILDQLIATNLPAWITPYCEFLKEFIQKEKFIVHTSGTTGNKKKSPLQNNKCSIVLELP